MSNREFRRAAAGKTPVGAVLLGALTLAAAGIMPLRAQQAAGGDLLSGGQVVTASLDYREVSYCFGNWGLDFSRRSSAFKKEPAFKGGKVLRGMLRFGGSSADEMGFAWDRAGRKLYLDLNRNLDLTDDPAGVCSCRRAYGDSYQTFTNVHLPFSAAAGHPAALVDLNLYSYRGLSGSAELRSFWQGKVTLQGQDWQFGLLANPFRAGSDLENGQMLLRPWSEGNQAFSTYSGTLQTLRFSRQVFWHDHAYRLRCTNVVQDGLARVRVEFAEEQPKLGELRITGQSIERVVLEGSPYLVVLHRPGSTAKVPVGRYGPCRVCLEKGGVQAHLDDRARAAEQRLVVSEKAAAVLTAGGPLTNSVSITRHGTRLALNYELVGMGGAYRLVGPDTSHPPEFTIYQGEKKIASGKFQYG